MPNNSPITGSGTERQTAWQFGMSQDVQSNKLRSSIGIFQNLSGTITGNSLDTGTINASLFKNGTIQTSVFSGTISQPSVTGGTFTNPLITTGTANTSAFNNGTLGTPQINNGTFNNGVIGTPSLTGGTLTPSLENAGSYQTGGTGGISGSIVYVKTVNFAGSTTTMGTLVFTNGLITANT